MFKITGQYLQHREKTLKSKRLHRCIMTVKRRQRMLLRVTTVVESRRVLEHSSRAEAIIQAAASRSESLETDALISVRPLSPTS